MVLGANSGLLNPEKLDFRPVKNSPSANKIKFVGEPETDFYNRPFKSIRSFGAIESE